MRANSQPASQPGTARTRFSVNLRNQDGSSYFKMHVPLAIVCRAKCNLIGVILIIMRLLCKQISMYRSWKTLSMFFNIRLGMLKVRFVGCWIGVTEFRKAAKLGACWKEVCFFLGLYRSCVFAETHKGWNVQLLMIRIVQSVWTFVLTKYHIWNQKHITKVICFCWNIKRKEIANQNCNIWIKFSARASSRWMM